MSIKTGVRTYGLRPECLLDIQEARAIDPIGDVTEADVDAALDR